MSGAKHKESSSPSEAFGHPYATKSTEAADENQRRVEAVFDELATAAPNNVSHMVFRLSDDEVSQIVSAAAFGHFQQDHEDRREGAVDQQTATLVGAYITVID